MAKKPKHTSHREPAVGDIDAAKDDLPRVEVGGERQFEARAERRSGKRKWLRWGWPLLTLMVVAALAWVMIYPDSLRPFIPQTRLEQQLQQAQKALDSGYFEGQDGFSAHELYQAILFDHSDNKRAQEGLQNVGQAEVDEARALIDQGKLVQANRLLASASSILGGGRALQKAQKALRQARFSEQNMLLILHKAQTALAENRIVGDAGALSLYAQVLAIDPSNQVAGHGLDQAAERMAQMIDRALDKGDISFARAQMDILREQAPDEAQLPQLEARFEAVRKASQAIIKTKLAKAEALLDEGDVWQDDHSDVIELVQSVLAIDPSNKRAHKLRAKTLDALVSHAQHAMDVRDLDASSTWLAYVGAINNKHPKWILANARLALMREAEQDKITENGPTLDAGQKAHVDDLLKRAGKALAQGNVLDPPGANAYDLYRQVLLVDAGNKVARQALTGLSKHVTEVFGEALMQGKLTRAERMLHTYQQLHPVASVRNKMRARLVTAWLDDAEKAHTNGHYQHALDSLEHAAKLDKQDARVKHLRKAWTD